MNVLYIFAGSRRAARDAGLRTPDTPWYGFTHLKDDGVNARTCEPERYIPRIITQLLGFRGKHVLMYFCARSYDIVFGSALIYPALLKRMFGGRAHYVLFNISTTRMLREAGAWNRLLIRFALRGIECVVCLSEAQRAAFVALAPECANKTRVVHLGTDVDYFDSIQVARSSFVLAAGRDNGRDYHTVYEVARALPDIQFRIVCSARNLKGLGAVPNNVTIMRDIPPETLAQLYKEARALLLLTHPDHHADGADCSGQTVLLDAGAAKVPIVATDRTYIHEYLPERAVRLVPPYDVQAVIAALDTITDSDQDEYAQRAYAHIRTHLTSRGMAHELATLFTGMRARYAPCPLCACSSFIDSFVDRHHHAKYGKCTACATIVLDRTLWPQNVDTHYESYYDSSFAGRSYALGHFSRRAEFVRRFIQPGGSVCEIGAASGEALHVLKQEGYEVAGVELSQHAITEAKAHYGIDLIHGTIHDARFPDALFDVVLMHHVFEHLTDPHAALAEVWRILKPGGVVVIEVPNPYGIDAWFSRKALLSILDYPHHTVAVPPSALKSFLAKRGWNVETLQHAVSFLIVQIFRRPKQKPREKRERSTVQAQKTLSWRTRARTLLGYFLPGMAYTVIARKPR